MKKFPKTIFVGLCNSGTGTDEWFNAVDNPDNLEDDGPCAVYELKEIGTATTKTEFKASGIRRVRAHKTS